MNAPSGGEVGSDRRDRGTGRRLAARPSRPPTPRARGPAPPVLAVEDLAEGGPEVGVEDGVDDRVEEAVEIAQPADHAHHERRDFQASFGAERADQGDDEERKPAADEGPGDDGQRPCSFPLPLLFQTLLGTLFLRRKIW